MATHYHTLGVGRKASTQEIKSAFKKLALQYHPDRNMGNPVAEERFKRINAAYQVLSDPDKKAKYDDFLRYGNAYSYQKSTNYQQQQSRQRRRYYQDNPYRQTNQQNQKRYRQSTRPEKNWGKMEIYSLIGFVSFAVICVVLFGILNRYSSKKHLEEAQIAYEAGQLNTATQEISIAISQDEENAEAHYLNACILTDQLKPQWAISSLTQAIKFGKTSSLEKYHLKRAQLQNEQGKYWSAVHDLEKAHQFNLKNDTTLFQLASTYLHYLKEYHKARFYFDKLLELDEKNSDALLGLAFVHVYQQQYVSAKEKIDQIRANTTSFPQADYLEGFYYLDYKSDTLKACHLWSMARVRGIREAQTPIDNYCK